MSFFDKLSLMLRATATQTGLSVVVTKPALFSHAHARIDRATAAAKSRRQRGCRGALGVSGQGVVAGPWLRVLGASLNSWPVSAS